MAWQAVVLPVLLVMSYFVHQQNVALEAQLDQDRTVYSQ
jgi:hypothetical protein